MQPSRGPAHSRVLTELQIPPLSAKLLSAQPPSLSLDEPMYSTSLFLEIYVRMPAFLHQETYENAHTSTGYKSPKPETFMADTVLY